MRDIRSDPELAAAVDRYVRPGRRYQDLRSGSFQHRLTGTGYTEFVRSLLADARGASDRELTILLEFEWRARLTAAVMAGLTRREVLRERIGSLLIESELVFAGFGYCVALACFATPQDAALLVRYLEHYLPRTDLRYDQHWAMAALLHLDERLGADEAARFTAPGGLWTRWWTGTGTGTEPAPAFPDLFRERMDGICALAVDVGGAGAPRPVP